jgi:hypothetical protein
MEIGLWIGEVLTSAEYWLVRATSAGLGMLRVMRAHPVLAAMAVMAGGGGAFATAMIRDDARIESIRFARIDQRAIVDGASLYRLNQGAWPSRLEAMVPGELRELHADPWGHPYAYYRGEGGIAVVSAGPDGVLGTPDDLVTVSPPVTK